MFSVITNVWGIAKCSEFEKTGGTREVHRAMKFVEIPAGNYVDAISHEKFEILPGIEIQDTPVTQWQWAQIMGENPAHHVDGLDAEEIVVMGKKVRIRPDAPIECICCKDVQRFIKKLNKQKNGYVYALPSVQEYQVVANAFKQNDSFIEHQSQHPWSITGKIWQFTRDTVAMKDKQAHVVFGGAREIKNVKDFVRPVVYDTSKHQAISLRLIRYRKQIVCEQKVTNYSSNQLTWNGEDCFINNASQWDELTNKQKENCVVNNDWHWDEQANLALLRGEDGLQWIFDHEADYSAETQYTLKCLRFWSGTGNIDTLSKLKNLAIRVKDIRDISPLVHLTNLTYLGLWSNKISDITPLVYLKKLTGLDLWRNEISDISSLAHLTSLTDLGLHDNCIQDFTTLVQLNNLKSLRLDSTQIKHFHIIKNARQLFSRYRHTIMHVEVAELPGVDITLMDTMLSER